MGERHGRALSGAAAPQKVGTQLCLSLLQIQHLGKKGNLEHISANMLASCKWGDSDTRKHYILEPLSCILKFVQLQDAFPELAYLI